MDLSHGLGGGGYKLHSPYNREYVFHSEFIFGRQDLMSSRHAVSWKKKKNQGSWCHRIRKKAVKFQSTGSFPQLWQPGGGQTPGMGTNERVSGEAESWTCQATEWTPAQVRPRDPRDHGSFLLLPCICSGHRMSPPPMPQLLQYHGPNNKEGRTPDEPT